VQNWEWFDPLKKDQTYDSSIAKMQAYLKRHVEDAAKIGKPLVLEEFGIARDKGSFDPIASVELRDNYYGKIFGEVYQYASSGTPLCGVNFWAWAGEGRPREPEALWKAGDDFIGDPPHEFQGWYSVYDADTTTHKVIKDYAQKMSRLGTAK
jgi:mannan endo-1,4-beta-mannosidase